MITNKGKPPAEERLSPDTHEFGITTDKGTGNVNPPAGQGWFLVNHTTTPPSTARGRTVDTLLWARRRNWSDK